MRTVGRLTLAAFLGAAFPATAFAQTPDRVSALAPAFADVDRIFTDYARDGHVPGMAWGVIVDGRLVHTGTFGVQDTVTQAPVTPDSVFRIASMTKSFTAAAILSLRDAGKLSLDDAAETYVPELKGLAYPTSDSPRLTIRHLLSHATGFPEDNPWGDQQLALSDDEMSALMRQGIPFSNPPGLAYEYSNYGFAILGRIVSKVSGMPYRDYVRSRLLEPLGLPATTLDAPAVPASRLVHGYRWEDERWKEEPPLPDGAFGAMGGMLTSLQDLVTVRGVDDGRLAAARWRGHRARCAAPRGARCSRCGDRARRWRGRPPPARCSCRPAAMVTGFACRRPAASVTSWRIPVACRDSDRRCAGCPSTASAWWRWVR